MQNKQEKRNMIDNKININIEFFKKNTRVYYLEFGNKEVKSGYIEKVTLSYSRYGKEKLNIWYTIKLDTGYPFYTDREINDIFLNEEDAQLKSGE